MCKNKKNTLRAIVVSLLVVIAFSAFFAANNISAEVITIEFDISKGPITITDAIYSGFKSDGTALTGTHSPENQYRITQSNAGTATENTITVGSTETGVAGNFYIILAGVNIRNNNKVSEPTEVYQRDNDDIYFGYAAFYANVDTNGTVAVILEDGTKNYLYSGANRAGLEKAGKSEGLLLITCEKGYTACSADSNSGHTDANGFSGCSNNCGYLDAKSGNAWDGSGAKQSYYSGAGIGTCGHGNDGKNLKTYSGGNNNSLLNLTIAGGNISATGAWGNSLTGSSGGAAAIGIGSAAHSGIKAGSVSIKITGGTINARRSDNSAACIGGGYRAGYTNIFIYGGTINAGMNAAGNEVKNPDMKFTRMRAAAIGGGGGGTSTNSPAGATVTIEGGEIYALGQFGSAIGAGAGGSTGDATKGIVKINGGTITAKTTKGADTDNDGKGDGAGAAIGAGGSLGKGKGGAGEVEITGGTITATSAGGADIGGGGTNSTDNDAGGVGVVTISGNPSITAMSGGIGGGRANKGVGGAATVTITSGTINAKTIGGGDSKQNNGGNCTVTISGGTVTVNNSDGVSIGGGDGSTTGGKGGTATLTVLGDAKLYTGSIGGGDGATIGPARVTISGGFLQGQVIMQGEDSEGNASTFSMTGGVIDNQNAASSGYHFVQQNGGAVWVNTGTANISDGTIKNCNNTGNLGGAIYLSGGVVNISGGSIENCKAANGGAVYVLGGHFNMTGGDIVNNTASESGGAVAVAGGDFAISDGTIINNTASQNGGGVAITNGNYRMTGGNVISNKALNGDGGGIYVSSSSASSVVIRSGNVTYNEAGNGGGALGVRGTGDAVFTIQIGSDTKHEDPAAKAHVCADDNALSEACPVILNNKSHKVGGGVYLAGSYNANLLIYCIVESGNKVGDGNSSSDFMKVEGGTLVISAKGSTGTSQDVIGNVVISGSVHVTGGRVTLYGLGDNPKFEERITVDITDAQSFFNDLRDKKDSKSYTVQYFEFFTENNVTSGQYISFDVTKGKEHTVQAGLYTHSGFLLKAWTLMMNGKNAEGEQIHVPSNEEFRIQLGLEKDKSEYAGNDTITVNGDIILYAKWETAGYSIIFKPGVDNYGGSMAQQEFSYTENKQLTPNAFTNVGYNFSHWKREDTGDTYKDKQSVEKLSNVDGAEIYLIAQWTICYHSDPSKYKLSSATGSISRECNCLGYIETATLEGFTIEYDGNPHPTSPRCSANSKNGVTPNAAEWDAWDELDFTIGYSGQNWSKVPFANPDLIQAGEYTATISYPSSDPVVSAFVNITINKADQDPPNVPQYDTEKLANDAGMVIKVKDTYQNRLEYLFTWYDEDEKQYKSSEVRWTDPNDPPTQPLNKIYTNYYVSVRYAGDDNHNPSVYVKGTWAVVYTGNVTFNFSADAGMTCQDSVKEADSGLVVTLTPQEGYYIYDVNIPKYYSSQGDDKYRLPEYENREISATQWKIRFFNIKDLQGNDTVNIYVHFTGAKLKATVEADTVKDQVFSSIYGKGEANVSISKDSAYTVRFDVDNFNHYKSPEIQFDHLLPVGTTLLMIDQSNASYWGYTVKNDSVTSVLLENFVRMGGTDKFAIGTTSFDLQFVVDFSRCAGTLNVQTLTAQFYATPVQPTYPTVPLLPSAGDAISTVSLVETLQFTVSETSGTVDDQLSKIVTFKYANVAESVGTSKWDSRRGVLVITPANGTTLPADARLQMTIGNSTDIYALKDGKYRVALPSGNSGEVSITLLSDMVPVNTTTYSFTVDYYSSETLVGSTPRSPLGSSVDLSYVVTKSAQPGLTAQIIVGENSPLPTYKDGSITSLHYSVSTSELPTGYKVKATLCGKNPDGSGYSATTQSSILTLTSGSFSGELGLASLAEDMRTKKGCLSMMLRIEVIDANGKVVNYVPLYFIVVDTRE